MTTAVLEPVALLEREVGTNRLAAGEGPTATGADMSAERVRGRSVDAEPDEPDEADQDAESDQSGTPSPEPLLLDQKKPTPAVEWGTPFVPSHDDGLTLDDLLVAQPTSLLREMLNDPRALAERLLDGRAAKTMTDTALTLLVSSAVAGAALGTATGGSAVRSMALLPIALVLAVVAALGPVAASAVMVGARVPWALLAGALTMATTRGAMVLCASAPLSVLAMRVDDEWAGPLVILTSFAVSGLLAGRLIRTMLEQSALVLWERAGSSLGGERLERVALVGRVGLVQLAFTLSIAVWSFRILG